MILNEASLILNKNWQPINVATVRSVMKMICCGNAKAVDASYQLYNWDQWAVLPPGNRFVRGSIKNYRVPEVVLTNFDKTLETLVTFSRRNIYKRDKYTCCYCNDQPKIEDLTIDHILPKSRGGESSWLNCCLACITCNHKKAARTPEEANMQLIKKPVKPHWEPLYARHPGRHDSWKAFISDAYWENELEKQEVSLELEWSSS